ncbi:MAG: CRISPR-associated endonuclease Cas3'', partial [Clostridiales bacterium]|nr:CRISPR-associated endonuclease Cas3'' [Clostridiales bacterium]
MYQLLDIEILKREDLWAHTREGKKNETLLEHSQLCIDYFNEYCRHKGIDEIVQNLIRTCGCNDIEANIIYDMFVNAIYLHDIGKVNPAYQARRLNNPMFKNNGIAYECNSNHALPSAYIYMTEFMPLIEGQSKRKLSFFLFAFSYCIARHHGYLKNTDGFKDDLMNCPVQCYYGKPLDLNKNSIFTTDKGYTRIKKHIKDEIAFFILCRLLFATITACDYCATAEYKNDIKFDISIIDTDDFSIWKKNHQKGCIYKGIVKYQENKDYFKSSPINALRSDMFLESEQRLKQFPNANIYYLEAPTGSGKTENSINLKLNILEMHPNVNNVFYIFPFNTLVEQTAETLEKYFEKDVDFAVVNSINPIVMKRDIETEEVDYEYSYLGRLFNNYPMVVTSHVNFFNFLFGCGKEQV